MPIPSGCCSRLAFRCVRFPAAVLGLRFFRRAGFSVSSGQSFVRAFRCASVFRLRPSACGFSAVPGFPSRPDSRSFGLSVVHPFPGSGPRLAVFRRAGFPVPSGQSFVRAFRCASVFRLRPSACGFSAVPGFPFRGAPGRIGLSAAHFLCRFSLCRFSLSAAPLCLLLSLQPHSLLPPRLYRCGRRLAGII